jgi:hypothetical protein
MSVADQTLEQSKLQFESNWDDFVQYEQSIDERKSENIQFYETKIQSVRNTLNVQLKEVEKRIRKDEVERNRLIDAHISKIVDQLNDTLRYNLVSEYKKRLYEIWKYDIEPYPYLPLSSAITTQIRNVIEQTSNAQDLYVLQDITKQVLKLLPFLAGEMKRANEKKTSEVIRSEQKRLEEASPLPQLLRIQAKLRSENEKHQLFLRKGYSKAKRELLDSIERFHRQEKNLIELRNRINEKRFPKLTKKLTKRWDLPDSTDPRFSNEVTRTFANLYMQPKTKDQGSGCSNNSDVMEDPKPYQELLSSLLEPDLPYLGFLAAFGTGSGKTRLGALSIQKHFLKSIETDPAKQEFEPYLILLPKTDLFPQWTRELKKWIRADGLRVEDDSKSSSSATNTVFLKLIKSSSSAWIILHKMTVVLPTLALSRMQKFEPIRCTTYNLNESNPYQHEAYQNLTPATRVLLQTKFEKQKQAVLEKSKSVQLLAKGLVLIDEFHNLINPQEIARDAVATVTVLAWINALKCSRSKRSGFTATPLLDEDSIPDLFRAMNLFLESKTGFEGVWRQAPLAVEEDYKSALVEANRLEREYMLQQLFDKSGVWKPEAKQTLVQTYGPVISFLTLENDPTVYPSFTKLCGPINNEYAEETCTFLWVNQTKTMKTVSSDELESYGLTKPKEGTHILIPMLRKQFEHLEEVMEKDLKRFSVTKRPDADSSTPSYDRINYGADTKLVQSSVLSARGMKMYADDNLITPKLEALLHLMKQESYAKDKFFAYTSEQDQNFFKHTVHFFAKHSAYKIIDPLEVNTFLNTAKDKSPEAFLSSLDPTKQYVILYVLSTSIKQKLNNDTKVINRIKGFLEDIWNHKQNHYARPIKLFLGDRSTKEGINLLHTKHAVLMDVPANTTMDKQAKSRVLRYCALRDFPFEEWGTVRLWKFINLPSLEPKVTRRRRQKEGGNFKTNEEYQTVYLSAHVSPGSEILMTLQKACFTCCLFADYNGWFPSSECSSCTSLISGTKTAKSAGFVFGSNFILVRSGYEGEGLVKITESEVVGTSIPSNDLEFYASDLRAQVIYFQPFAHQLLLVNSSSKPSEAIDSNQSFANLKELFLLTNESDLTKVENDLLILLKLKRLTEKHWSVIKAFCAGRTPQAIPKLQTEMAEDAFLFEKQKRATDVIYQQVLERANQSPSAYMESLGRDPLFT